MRWFETLSPRMRILGLSGGKLSVVLGNTAEIEVSTSGRTD
jgi:hypothetical protein